MKPLIGVMPLWDEEKKSIWMLPDYLEGIEAAGGLPFVFPLTSGRSDLVRLTKLCDGLLLTGGQDVSPEIYGAEPAPEVSDCCKARDRMESIVLNQAITSDKPLLGICRGIQFINAALGGTLYRHIPSELPSEIVHKQQPPYDNAVHTVNIVKGSPLFRELKTDKLAVNSYHHQGIKDLSPRLSAMAHAEDGLIEAVCMPRHCFLWAVQWHPEFSFKTDENSQKIFSALVYKAANH